MYFGQVFVYFLCYLRNQPHWQLIRVTVQIKWYLFYRNIFQFPSWQRTILQATSNCNKIRNLLIFLNIDTVMEHGCSKNSFTNIPCCCIKYSFTDIPCLPIPAS